MNFTKKHIIAAFILLFSIKAAAQFDFPSIEILSVDSNSIFKTSKIAEGKPVAFLFFQTSCEHCQKVVANLVANHDKLKNVQLVLLSFETTNLIKQFYKEYNLKVLSKLIIGKDFRYAGMQVFKFESFPYCAIYSKKRKYLGSLENNFFADSILDLLKKDKG